MLLAAPLGFKSRCIYIYHKTFVRAIEWSVLSRQALSGRLADIAAVEARVNPWQMERNQRRATVNWCFSTTHARTKLARLYPG